MKYVILLLLFISGGTSFAQFEGVVVSRNMTTDEIGAPQEFIMSVWIKDGMAKITNTATASSPAVMMVYRNDLKVVWMINDDEKSYFEVSQIDTAAKRPAQGGMEEKPSVRKTKKTKKILGYACQQFIVTHGEAQTEIWATKALPRLTESLSKVLGHEETGPGISWTDELARLGVLPLVALTRLEGKVIESQEVTKIEQRQLPAEMFALPAGYKKQSVGDMLK